MLALFADINESFDTYSDYLSIASSSLSKTINSSRLNVLAELKKDPELSERYCRQYVNEFNAATEVIYSKFLNFAKFPSRANSRIYYEFNNNVKVNEMYASMFPEKFANKMEISLNTILDDTIISWTVISRLMVLSTYLCSTIIRSSLNPIKNNKDNDKLINEYNIIISKMAAGIMRLVQVLPIEQTYIPIHLKLLSVLSLISISLKSNIFGSCTHALDCLTILASSLRPENKREPRDKENNEETEEENRNFMNEEAKILNCAYVLKISPKEAMSQSFIFSGISDLLFLLNEMLTTVSSTVSFPEISVPIRIKLAEIINRITTSLSESKVISKYQTVVLQRAVDLYNSIQKQKKAIIIKRREAEIYPHQLNVELKFDYEDYVIEYYKKYVEERNKEKAEAEIMISKLVKEVIESEESESENDVDMPEEINDSDNEEIKGEEIIENDDMETFNSDESWESDDEQQEELDNKSVKKAIAIFDHLIGK